MVPAEAARARHHSYALLQHLYLFGVTDAVYPHVTAIPALAETLPEAKNDDALAAAHYDLFGLNLFPYESIFLDPQGLLGGRIANEVARIYWEANYRVSDDGTSPDHMGHELGLLAHLCDGEANALEAGSEAEALTMQEYQRAFLNQHLLPWLAPLHEAVQRQEDPFFRGVANLTRELVLSHAVEIGINATMPPLATAPKLLSQSETGLKQIALFLTVPPFSGLFLSRTDISRLARGRSLPRGFGTRQQMFTNLLRAAAEYDELDPLLASLQDVMTTAERSYTESVADYPQLASFAARWRERVRAAHDMIGQMRAQISPLGS